MIPSLLLFSPFQKGYVRSHTRKGKQVGPYFTKRKPSQVQTKHTKERFIDHDKASASKAHEELESLKAKRQELLDTAQKHHDELKSKGSSEGAVDHKTKLSHLKAEINNQKTHIENHSRKQNLIKDRYKISSKQIVRKKEKSDLDRKIAHHSDEQKKTIRAIHGAHQKGQSKLEPSRILKGKDKDHIYLETKHADTGATHHIAIHKDGAVKDPNILHGGKFEAKGLTEDSGQKKIVVKTEPKKGVTVKKQEDPQTTMKMALGMSRSEAIQAIKEEGEIRAKAPKIKTLSQKVKSKKIVVNTDPDKGPVKIGTMTASGDFTSIEEGMYGGDNPETKKKIVVKKEKDKSSYPPTSAQTTFKRKSTIDDFVQQAKEQGLKIGEGFTFRLGDVKNKIYRVEGKDKSGNFQAYAYVKGEKQQYPITIPKELKKSITHKSKQLESLLKEEKLSKSLKSPEEIKLLKDKRKRRKKRKNKR